MFRFMYDIVKWSMDKCHLNKRTDPGFPAHLRATDQLKVYGHSYGLEMKRYKKHFFHSFIKIKIKCPSIIEYLQLFVEQGILT